MEGLTALITSYNQGLGTCSLGSYNGDAVKKVMGIPRNIRVLGSPLLDYTKRIAKEVFRKPVEEMVAYEGF